MILNLKGAFNITVNKKQFQVVCIPNINMFIAGTNIKDTIAKTKALNEVVLSMSQLLIFNFKKYTVSLKETQKLWHVKSQETQLQIYLSLMIHNKTRNREIIGKLHEYGIGISYMRLMDISTAFGESVEDCYNFYHFYTDN